jgi:uncharacterized protein (TIGR02598 family)
VFRLSTAKRKSGPAFSLVEVTLALGVAGFCLLAILGLLQTGLTNEKVTVGQTAAAGILSAVYSDIVSTRLTNPISPNFQVSLNNQTLVTPQTIYFAETGWTNRAGQAPGTNSRYRVSVGVQSTNTGPTPVRILVTWPAAADPTNASGSVEVVTALDRS